MQLRELGTTGLRAYPLGFGAMELRRMEAADTAPLLRGVLDLGINYIDTSPDYRGSEEAIGAAIADRRSEYLLATKCGCNLSGEGPDHYFTPEHLRENLEESLRRMRTDYVDIWQLHCITAKDLENGMQDCILAEMQRAKQAGLVRAIGVSFRNGKAGTASYPAQECYDNLELFSRLQAFDLFQMVYGGLTRQNERLIAEAAERGAFIVARGVLNRYYENYDALASKAGLDELFEPGEDLNGFLIRFVLSNPSIAMMIVGSRSVAHMAQNVAAAERGALSPERYTEACRRLAAIGSAPDVAPVAP